MGAGGAIVLVALVVLALSVLVLIGLILTALGASTSFGLGRGPRLALLGAGAAFLLLVGGLVLAYFSLFLIPPPAKDIAWDFSETHNVGQLEGEPTGGYYIYSGDIDLSMELPDDRSYMGKATHVTVSAEQGGDRIQSIDIKLKEMSRRRAYEQSIEVIRQWRLDEGRLEDWYRHKSSESEFANDDVVINSRPDLDLALSISVRQSTEQSWIISLGVYWHGEAPQ